MVSDLKDMPKFDLVIVDEIHHARNANTYVCYQDGRPDGLYGVLSQSLPGGVGDYAGEIIGPILLHPDADG
jgi:hypothetical protein